MSPAIPARARLRVRLLGAKACAPDDVVLYVSDAGFMAHRIAHLQGGDAADSYAIAIGDNCLVPDPPVMASRIVGVVTAVRAAGDWYPPGRAIHRSIYHRLVRGATCGAVLAVSRVSLSAAVRAVSLLQRAVSVFRVPVGRLLRVLHLLSPQR